MKIPIRLSFCTLASTRKISSQPSQYSGTSRGILQRLIKEQPLIESNFQIIKNRSMDPNWNKPSRRLRKAEKNYPKRQLLFENGIEANTIPLPSHIEPFVLPLVKLEINYCSHNKNSDILKGYLSLHMVDYAKEHPSVEFLIRPRFSKPPQAIATYNTGRVETMPLHKKSMLEIHTILMDLRSGSGYEPKKFHLGVHSHASAIRPLWDPWHGANLTPFDGSEQVWRRSLKISTEKFALERKAQKNALFVQYSTFYKQQNQAIINRPKPQNRKLKMR